MQTWWQPWWVPPHCCSTACPVSQYPVPIINWDAGQCSASVVIAGAEMESRRRLFQFQLGYLTSIKCDLLGFVLLLYWLLLHCSYAIFKLLIYLLSYLLHHQIYCNQTITSITIMKAIELLSIPGQVLTPNHANVVPAPVSAPCLCSQ